MEGNVLTQSTDLNVDTIQKHPRQHTQNDV